MRDRAKLKCGLSPRLLMLNKAFRHSLRNLAFALAPWILQSMRTTNGGSWRSTNKDNFCGWTSSITISKCRKNFAPLSLRRKVLLNRWKKERDYFRRSLNTKSLWRNWNPLQCPPLLRDHLTSRLKPELFVSELPTRSNNWSGKNKDPRIRLK